MRRHGILRNDQRTVTHQQASSQDGNSTKRARSQLWRARAYSLAALFTVALTGLPAAPVAAQPQPTIAIIIDDVGNSREEAQRLIRIPVPLTLSFLPFLPHTASLAAQAHAAGKEVMLHVPMQNTHNKALGPGALTLDMRQPVFVDTLRRALQAVPYVRGINNHMGSALTQQPVPMRWTMEELQKYPLYFVDSRTTALTVAQTTAEAHRIPNLARDVFLDHEITPEAIDREFKRLLSLARARGTAVAIGHPHRATLDYLERVLPELGAEGVAIASVSALWMIRNNGRLLFEGRLPSQTLPTPVDVEPTQSKDQLAATHSGHSEPPNQ